jgi:hypothetical protein
MRLVPLLVIALVAHLAGGASWAKIPKACHQCHAVCGDSISECIDATEAACTGLPRGKAHRCKVKTKHLCHKGIVATCIDTCRQSGSPACIGDTVTTTTEPNGFAPTVRRQSIVDHVGI